MFQNRTNVVKCCYCRCFKQKKILQMVKAYTKYRTLFRFKNGKESDKLDSSFAKSREKAEHLF